MGKKVIPSRKGSSTRNFFSAGAAWAAGAAGLAAGAAAGAQDASARQSTSPKDAHAVSGRIASVLSPRADHLTSEVGAAPEDDLPVEVLHDAVQHQTEQ